MNTYLQVFVWIPIFDSLGYTSRRQLLEHVGILFSLQRNCQTVSHCCISSYTLTSIKSMRLYEGSRFSTSLTTLVKQGHSSETDEGHLCIRENDTRCHLTAGFYPSTLTLNSLSPYKYFFTHREFALSKSLLPVGSLCPGVTWAWPLPLPSPASPASNPSPTPADSTCKIHLRSVYFSLRSAAIIPVQLNMTSHLHAFSSS